MRSPWPCVLLTIVLCVPACGSTTGDRIAPASAPPAPALVLGDRDNGREVMLRTGQRVMVQLTADTYDPPTADTPAVLARTATDGGYPTARPASATFTAAMAGHSSISAMTDRACAHSTPRCLVATRLWRVEVTVP